MVEIELWEWLLLVSLLFMSAFFSGSETALMSLSRLRIHHLVEKGVPNAPLVDRLVSNPNHLLSTILIGNNIVNIGASALATSIALRLFGQAGVGIAVAVLTVFILIFGEITPKTYAAANNESMSLRIARIINFLQTIFKPIIKILGLISGLIIKLMGSKEGNGISITEDEIRTLVELGKDQGSIEKSELEMIKNVFELNDTLVREVMVPRVDITGISSDITLADAWKIFIETKHSRIPVYSDNIDSIIGILHLKDLMINFEKLNSIKIKEIMREPYFVPETKKLSELLLELRQERMHIAVILDEYGGTAGLAFLEDLVETIVGYIGDEYDVEPLLVESISEGEYIVDARISVEEINELFDLDLPIEEHDTMGGLIFHLLGHIPTTDETIEFADVTFKVAEVSNKRIIKIIITTNKK